MAAYNVPLMSKVASDISKKYGIRTKSNQEISYVSSATDRSEIEMVAYNITDSKDAAAPRYTASAEEMNSFLEKALEIIHQAEQRHIPLRLFGGAAIRYHCQHSDTLYFSLERRVKMDMDFMTFGKYRNDLQKLLAHMRYPKKKSLSMALSFDRDTFNDNNGQPAIDVLYDRFEMCHKIKLSKEMFERETNTLPLAELLAQKLQIIELNQKDIADVIILLHEHEVAEHDKESVNAPVIANMLSNDWGFWYTVTQVTIPKIAEHLHAYTADGKIPAVDSATVEERLNALQRYIDSKPKSPKWKMRAVAGTKMQWYDIPQDFS